MRRLASPRLWIDGPKRQGIRAEVALPISRLVIGKDGRARLAIAEGVLGAQPARTPLGDILGVGITIRLLAGDDDGLVSGDKARVHFAIQRLSGRHAIRVVPNPDIADFKPGLLQVEGKPMRHIGEAKHGDVRPGLQDPEKFHPDEKVWQNQIPADAPHLLAVGRVDHTPVNAVAWYVRQSEKRIACHQVYLRHLNLRRKWRRKVCLSWPKGNRSGKKSVIREKISRKYLFYCQTFILMQDAKNATRALGRATALVPKTTKPMPYGSFRVAPAVRCLGPAKVAIQHVHRPGEAVAFEQIETQVVEAVVFRHVKGYIPEVPVRMPVEGRVRGAFRGLRLCHDPVLSLEAQDKGADFRDVEINRRILLAGQSACYRRQRCGCVPL